MILNGRELRRLADTHGAAEVVSTLEHCLELGREGQPGGVRPEEFSVRDLFESLIPDGREALRMLDPRQASVAVMEADVDTTLFANITGQIVYSRILQAYMNEAFVFSRLIPAVPTQFLDGEKIAGMAHIGDQAEEVAEGAQYPRSTFGEEFIETPATEKRGNIVSLTKESIFADRTGLILRRASMVGEWLGVNKEKRLIQLVVGAVNNYKRNGVSLDTYQTAVPWINTHSNPLVNWESVEKSELLFADIPDPNTGEPIMLSSMDLVVTPFKYRTGMRILNATEVRHTNDGAETLSANPMSGAYGLHKSMQMYQQLQVAAVDGGLGVTPANAREYHFLGDFGKAFNYMEAYPITPTQAPQNSYLSFERDIVAEYKASERGVGAVVDPRYVVRSTN